MSKPTEIETLLLRYERIADILRSLDDARGTNLVESIDRSVRTIRELSRPELSRLKRQICTGLRQGIHDLRVLASWAPDGVIDRIITAGEGDDLGRDVALSAVLRNERIANEDEYQIVRSRDEIEGDPDFESETQKLRVLTNRFENI